MLSGDLFEASRNKVAACLAHPFVEGLADGSLDPEVFRRYVAQDAFYLRAFARAYALAAARCPDHEAVSTFARLIRGVSEELELHAGFSSELGIDLDAARPMDSTLAYTDFLLATAWHSGLSETIAAMAPCMRLYAFLGGELARDGIPDHRYGRWVETYSSVEFVELADLLDGLLDRFGSDTEAVRAAYARAMSLEYLFFDACFHGGQP
ncbi:MAG: TenA family protein [Planctomycetota bacterium]|jgi:thiaminase/transcriptional activator TenA